MSSTLMLHSSDSQPAGSGDIETDAHPIPYGGRLMFTQSWEDPACDIAALRPQPGDTMFAVTSGGDNVLEFLLSDPGKLIAVDLNPTQTYLLELKMAAFRELSHEEMLHLLGVRSTQTSRELYGRLENNLTDEARAYWSANLSWFDEGLLTRGGFERYFALLRRILRVLVGRKRMEHIFLLTPRRQREFYEDEWNTLRYKLFLRVLCSKWVLSKRLDPSWFEHAEVDSFGQHFTGMANHVLAVLPARSNYFLAQILLGRYLDEKQVPKYLRPENFDTIRDRLDRIEIRTQDVGDALGDLADQSVDTLALSNVFEYSPPELFERSKRSIARVAKPGARLSLRNLLAPRILSDDPTFVVDRELSERLQKADRGFIYSRFQAAIIRRER